jgi:hypothetical protein
MIMFNDYISFVLLHCFVEGFVLSHICIRSHNSIAFFGRNIFTLLTHRLADCANLLSLCDNGSNDEPSSSQNRRLLAVYWPSSMAVSSVLSHSLYVFIDLLQLNACY